MTESDGIVKDTIVSTSQLQELVRLRKTLSKGAHGYFLTMKEQLPLKLWLDFGIEKGISYNSDEEDYFFSREWHA